MVYGRYFINIIVTRIYGHKSQTKVLRKLFILYIKNGIYVLIYAKFY